MPDHLIYVVHGIGNQYDKHCTFVQNLEYLEKTCLKVQDEVFEDSDTDIQWIPIGIIHLTRVVFKIARTGNCKREASHHNEKSCQ
jgi:hypothetical protein